MKRNRGSAKKYIESSDSENDRPLKKTPPSSEEKPTRESDSSSESDIENYLSKPEKLDFSSDFFKTKNGTGFENIEKNIFSGISRLSDSGSEADEENGEKQEVSHNSDNTQTSTVTPMDNLQTTMTFQQLQDYTKRIEEAKQFVDKYKARKETEENKNDIQQLLALGEKNNELLYKLNPGDFHSSDFDSYESDDGGWKEVKSQPVQETEKSLIPQKNIQITVSMPETIKKRKGVDLITAMKRRLNRIRKENQVLVHKVHLLCWLAHDRPDLSYLEQITKWYGRTIKLLEKPVPANFTFDTLIRLQIKKKEAYNKKMLACIFITILRALGIQCRIVLSFLVEPLRPPTSELHSLSQKEQKASDKKRSSVVDKTQNEPVAGTSKSPQVVKQESNKAIKMTGDQDSDESHNKSKKRPHSTESQTVSRKKNMKSEKDIDKLTIPKPARQSKSPKNAGGVKTEQKTPVSKKKNNASPQTSRSSSETEKKEVESKTDPKKSNEKSSSTKRCKSLNPPEKGQKTNVDTVAKDSASLLTQPKITISKSPKVSPKDSASRLGKTKETTRKDDLSVPKLRRRPKSAETKDKKQKKSVVARSKSTESSETVNRRGRPRKNIPQVDGVWDSDSDEELIIPQLDGVNDGKKSSKPNLKVLKSSSKQTNKKKIVQSDSESDFELPRAKSNVKPNLKKLNCNKPKQIDIRNDIITLVKGRIAEQKHIDRKRLVKKRKPADHLSDSDSDYVPEPIKKKHHDSEDDFVPKVKVKRRVQIPGKIPEEEKLVKKKMGNDVWVEVFLEAEEKWISVDVVHGQVHCVKEIYQRASHPVTYVVAWDNNNNLKDVTQRYCPNFNTITRKERVYQSWWSESLKPFMGLPTARDKEEDNDFVRQQMDQPLPKSIAEYKNHPLYVLKRHLLKFEGLYPPDTPTLGFVRGEAVYPRTCVYLLHSRDIWLKQAKVVKLGEQPYKIVKARPKYDKLSNKIITDQLLEIYGPWQVQDYEPPTAENGIVPRNAFGNVDLFKPCMLPKGTVHLKLPGLNKVARRMNIDCASAIIGFDFHGGWSHPIYDGFVVCKEYEDQLVLAWEIEQDELDRKEQEKIDKRVYGNWKRLIRGLLIREKLKAKYDFGDTSAGTSKDKKKKKTPSFCTKTLKPKGCEILQIELKTNFPDHLYISYYNLIPE
ncbi:hypothetical protein GWI33_018570 [Rhynchophorus ferrugineus]|uniref:Uncharacterized protein n=1 Tax=Rhynchophorus ferrugineus TaxID=354439 RepID=A0A834M665_RHYFE|nr:hypothetical protein GWI33_018570 [Rhynchophorus ferrugineus]